MIDKKIKRPIVRYHGGKWMLAPWIIGYMQDHRKYTEAFGGGGSVLLRKKRAYAEVYNELDAEMVNLFRIARDRKADFAESLRLTPFSREEFQLSYQPTNDDFERARRTVVRSFMGFCSSAACGMNTGFRANSNRSGSTPAHDWMNYPEALKRICDRLRGVVIENSDAIDVMQYFDSVDTLHYVDPPYLLETRRKTANGNSYRFEMDYNDHRKLIEFLKTLKGMVILSGYPNSLYDNSLSDWHTFTKTARADGAKATTEKLWINRAQRSTQTSLLSLIPSNNPTP